MEDGLTVPAQHARTQPGTAGDTVLDISGVSKTFGLQRVLDDVSLRIRAGEIRALVGENGSGKSTLIKILAGYHVPDAGTAVKVCGKGIALHDPGVSDAAGLRFVHQDLGLVEAMSTVENLGLGRGYGARMWGPVRWKRRAGEARGLMRRFGYDVDVGKPVSSLTASERTAVAVVRAVSRHDSRVRVLVLDEPTANLPGPEVDRLFSLVRRVREEGIAVLFVSHHLNEVFDLADSVTVLRGGAVVGTHPVRELSHDRLIELMVGRAVEAAPIAPRRAEAPVVLSATGLSGGSVAHVDLDVAEGEILGIAGITGSGRESIASLLFGAIPRTGTVALRGRPLRPGRPDLSIAAGIALVPADRAVKAVLHGHDVSENISIVRPGDFTRLGLRLRRLERDEASRWLHELDVRPRVPRIPLEKLSGGNAQKVVLARSLRGGPDSCSSTNLPKVLTSARRKTSIGASRPLPPREAR